jgi:hypothetical protein
VTRESACDVWHLRTVRAAVSAVAVVASALVAPGFVGASRADEAPPAFSGSAAASGVRLTVKSTNVPLTDTPAEGGGPTAQVVVESAGTSQGYAAMPDPGPIVIGGPAIMAGVLAGGVPGVLPPTQVPPPPGYPFFVQSDATSAPEAKFDSGPVHMNASSEHGASKASSTTGVQAEGAGNAGLATSTAEIAPAGGAVVAKAVSRIEALIIGPLTIGAVTSEATETLDGSGKLIPSTSLRIDGMKVGEVSVGLSPEGFGAGGTTTPVPLNPALDSVLKASGISIRFVAAQTYPNRVVAPALEVTMPFDSGPIPGGQYKGTMTLTLGFATAAMTPAGGTTNPLPDTITGQSGGSESGGTDTLPAQAEDQPGGTATAGPSSSDSVGGTTVSYASSNGYASSAAGNGGDATAVTVGDTSGVGGASMSPADNSPSAAPLESSSGSAAPSDVAAGQFLTENLASRQGSSRLDIRGIYLIGVLAAVTALAGGEAVRRLGVRHEG